MSNSNNQHLEKISKYTYRLKKSFKQNDFNKSAEYLSHLKHYIQQTGGNEQDELNNKFEKLEKILNKIKTEPNLNIKKQVSEKEEELLKVKEEAEKLTKALEVAKKALKTSQDNIKEKSQNNEDIEKLNKEIEKLKSQLDTSEGDKENKFKIMSSLENEINDLKAQNESEKKNYENKIQKYNEIFLGLVTSDEIADLDSDQNNKIKDAVKKITDKLSNAQNTIDENQKLTAELNTLQEQLKNLVEIQNELTASKTTIEKLEKELANEKTKNVTLEESLNDNNRFISDKASQLDTAINALLSNFYDQSTVNQILNA